MQVFSFIIRNDTRRPGFRNSGQTVGVFILLIHFYDLVKDFFWDYSVSGFDTYRVNAIWCFNYNLASFNVWLLGLEQIDFI